MKKVLTRLGSIALLAGATSLANASMITLEDTTYFTSEGTNASEDYVDHGRGDVNFLSTSVSQALHGDYDYVTWKHLYDFTPPADTLISATLSLDLRDDQVEYFDFFQWEWVSTDDLAPEIGAGIAEDGTWDIGFVDTGTYSYALGLSGLADGMFEVTMISKKGDFYIDSSMLSIDYIPVPEPGTMLLLGSGLLGLGLARRRQRAA